MSAETIEVHDKLRVFLSYAREDAELARRIRLGLEFEGGFDVTIDTEDILPTEVWRDRLDRLISEADAVVFVLSPDSANSREIEWELARARERGKRVVPVLARPLADTQVPADMAALNYIIFDGVTEIDDFLDRMAQLCDGLLLELDWIREHTRLLLSAEEWDRAGRSTNRLLFGNDIAQARQWIERRPANAPSPTELHHTYIAASEAEEEQRLSAERARVAELEGAMRRARRATMVAAGLGAIMFAGVVGGGAVWGLNELSKARAERETAVTRQQTTAAQLESARDGLKQQEAAQDGLADTPSVDIAEQVAREQRQIVESVETPTRVAGRNRNDQDAEVGYSDELPPPGNTRSLAPQRPGEMSEASIDFLLEQEDGLYDPGGTDGAPKYFTSGGGLVIGIGYDLGFVDEAEFQRDWRALPASIRDRIAPAAGLRGEDARKMWSDVRNVTIPYGTAEQVFRQTLLPKYVALTRRAFPGSEQLPADSFGALVSLVYNRGAGMSGDRRVEMRAIRDLIDDGNFDAVPAQFCSMQRLWDGRFEALIARRDAEARLFQRGLGEAETGCSG